MVAILFAHNEWVGQPSKILILLATLSMILLTLRAQHHYLRLLTIDEIAFDRIRQNGKSHRRYCR